MQYHKIKTKRVINVENEGCLFKLTNNMSFLKSLNSCGLIDQHMLNMFKRKALRTKSPLFTNAPFVVHVKSETKNQNWKHVTLTFYIQ